MATLYRSIDLSGPVRALRGRAKQNSVELHDPITKIERDGDTVFIHSKERPFPYEVPWHAVLGAEKLVIVKEEPRPKPEPVETESSLMTGRRLTRSVKSEP